ncbi:MAG TPA: hypothetical protein VF909_16385 [Roseiflexaceae bacterium]
MPEDHLKRWIGAHAGLAFPLPPRLWALLALAVTDLDSMMPWDAPTSTGL